MATSLFEVSIASDERCSDCGNPAAEGAIVNGQVLCRAHAQAAIFYAAEQALWCLVSYCGSDGLHEVVEAVGGPGYMTGKVVSFG